MNCYRRYKLPSGQHGAALIVAIFVLALAMVMITALSTSFVVAVRRTDNQLLSDQAWYYLTGAEQLASELLLAQLKDRAEQQADTLYRPELFGQYETDDGWLSFTVYDLQGRFNLNNLNAGAGVPGGVETDENGSPQAAPPTAGASNTGPVPSNLWQKRFVRLLLSIEEPQLAEPDAIAITEAVLDWLDDNVLETGFGGAEQTFYAQGPLPYRPADMAMRDISELLLVKGITPQIYAALRESVTVWPREGASINVASVDRMLIQALYDKEQNLPMAPQQAEELLQAIREGEVTTLGEFLQRPEWGSVALKAEQLVDSSEVFLIRTQTQVGRIRQSMDSVVKVGNDQSIVLARSMRML